MEQAYNITFEQMLEVYDRGVVGTKEFRHWLSIVHPTFGTIRDPDVDEEITKRAEANKRALDEYTTETG